MAEPIFVALNDTQKKRNMVFNFNTATLAFAETHVEVVTGQGVKFRANPQEVLTVMQSLALEICQVVPEQPVPQEVQELEVIDTPAAQAEVEA